MIKLILDLLSQFKKKNGGILENEIYFGNELVQRYWISLKKRFVTNPKKYGNC